MLCFREPLCSKEVQYDIGAGDLEGRQKCDSIDRDAGEIQDPYVQTLEESNKVRQILPGWQDHPEARCTPNVQPSQRLSELYLGSSRQAQLVFSGRGQSYSIRVHVVAR
jgi:hypothetical protein